MSSGKVPLAPRPARSHISGFTIPFQWLRMGAHQFWEKLQAARASHANPTETIHWDTYALATQVFAAMTVEAQLNTYGFVRFGEALFRKQFQRKGPVERLKRMAVSGAGVRLGDGDPLVRTLVSLVRKRNPIVHMQSNEEVFDQAGNIIQPAPRPPDHLADAKTAIEEMEAFVRAFAELVAHHDVESLIYIMPL
jgi:hypothetical protein